MNLNLFLQEEMKKEYFIKIMSRVNDAYDNATIYPDINKIFNAFSLIEGDVKVVILGQDPYHGAGQAHGLAFSVLCSKLPPSLKNIYREMENDLGKQVNQSGDLSYLAKQGVLLLNTILTVEEHKPLSHLDYGWQRFTDRVMEYLNNCPEPICFILWGNKAIEKEKMLDNPKHLLIKSAHPSPLSAYNGFFNSHPFTKCNEYLKENKLLPIQWINNQND